MIAEHYEVSVPRALVDQAEAHLTTLFPHAHDKTADLLARFVALCDPDGYDLTSDDDLDDG